MMSFTDCIKVSFFGEFEVSFTKVLNSLNPTLARLKLTKNLPLYN